MYGTIHNFYPNYSVRLKVIGMRAKYWMEHSELALA